MRRLGSTQRLVILLDDVEIGASSASATSTCRWQRSRDGLKYNRFHTTALCSPTRQALLTAATITVGMGGITEIATSAPGYSSLLPNTAAPLAEVLNVSISPAAPVDPRTPATAVRWHGRLTENSVINVKNKSHAVKAKIVGPESGANGVIVAQGGAFGGWSLYVTNGRPAYCYNLFGLQQFKVYGDEPLPAGDHQVRMEFGYDGGGLAKGGDVTLFVDSEKAGQGRVDATQPMVFSATRPPTSAVTVPPRERRLRAGGQHAHREALGGDRHRRGVGGPRPPDHTGGAAADRDGQAVISPQAVRKGPRKARAAPIRRRVLIAACIGNFVEWYDFALYGVFATVLAATFFPGTDDLSRLVAAFAIFGIAFVARPVGALLFASYGDRHGRQRALVAGIALMALVTAGIGLLPGYDSLGWLAPILLLTLRAGQGAAVGGEQGGSAAFILEHAPADRRGWYGGWQYATVGLGLGAGLAAGALLSLALSTAALQTWGWRLAFLLALPLGTGRALHSASTRGDAGLSIRPASGDGIGSAG